MLYRPFADNLQEVPPEDLIRLKDVHEGWYAEYKGELIANRELAKSLSSFANQYGGWLFLGVKEDSEENVASSFPGIPKSQVQNVLDSIRNSAKDLLNPSVFYNVREFEGPIDAIGLPVGRSIIVVQIPEGLNSPYIHNDGRIYRRVGDSSQPTPVTDRLTFDLLTRRGEEARSRLEERVLWTPVTSKGEENQPFIHVSVMSDPYEIMGHWYSGRIAEFANSMRGYTVPFDNVFSTNDGYIARQVSTNDAYGRVFTWHFSRHCHSFVTFPIQMRPTVLEDPIWDEYENGRAFISKVFDAGLTSARILDLNILMDFLLGVVRRHRIVVGDAGVKGPFYLKANIENVWRTVPFVDHTKFLQHISNFGLPLNQESDMTVPIGPALDTFIVSQELSEVPSERDRTVDLGAIMLFLSIVNALGIPREILGDSIDSVGELQLMGRRHQEIQRFWRSA
jgi:hypothetical protein